VASFATLLDHFHLKPHDLLPLTDLQIRELYFHARKEDGSMIVANPLMEREPLTLNEALLQIDAIGGGFRLSPENIAELKQKMREKWAAKEAAGH
jgi:hypothetical protein